MKVIKMVVFEKGRFKNKQRVMEFAIRKGNGIIILDNKKVFYTEEGELLETCEEILKIAQERNKRKQEYMEEFEPKPISKPDKKPKKIKKMDMEDEEDMDF